MTAAESTMTREVVFVPPEVSLQQAWTILQRRNIRHLPIVAAGELLGILSDRDILLHAHLRADGEIVVPEIPVALAMTANPVTCERTTPISEIVRLFVERKIDSMPVVDRRKTLVGLVTSTDLLLLLLDGDLRRPLPYKFELYEERQAA